MQLMFHWREHEHGQGCSVAEAFAHLAVAWADLLAAYMQVPKKVSGVVQGIVVTHHGPSSVIFP